jgi:hypothetical protein
MKKTLLFGFIMIFMLSASTFAASKNPERLTKFENKLSEEEVTRLTSRVEEIRDMDKSDMAASEKRELRKELKGIKKNVNKNGGVIYLSAGTVILILILIILLV